MTSPRVEIVCIGTELLTDKVNTHTVFLGEKLLSIGLNLTQEQTVGDDPKIMEQVFSDVLKRADVIFSCGGLGPTFDDITRDVWSKVLKLPLHLDEDLFGEIKEKFRRRIIKMPAANKRQAYLLKGALIIPNENGTAPGQYLTVKNKTIILLPGPARELFPMVEEFVLPKLHTQYSSAYIKKKSFLSVGVPESKIDEMIRPIVSTYKNANGCRVNFGILASQSIITFKFSVEGKDQAGVDKTEEYLSEKFRAKLKPYIFGEDEETLPGVIGQLLRSKNQTLAVAESCTGGLISKMMTDEPGASDYFKEGTVNYSNSSKEKTLGVSHQSLVRYGAVSKQVAKEMAEGIRKKADVDYALSVTGIAGPTGGTPEKPVGLVYIGLRSKKRTLVKEFQFTGEREWIRHRSALMALDLLRKEILA